MCARVGACSCSHILLPVVLLVCCCLLLLLCVLQSHRGLCEGVSALARRVQADRELTNLIRRKFAIKCTTGRGLCVCGGGVTLGVPDRACVVYVFGGCACGPACVRIASQPLQTHTLTTHILLAVLPLGQRVFWWWGGVRGCRGV